MTDDRKQTITVNDFTQVEKHLGVDEAYQAAMPSTPEAFWRDRAQQAEARAKSARAAALAEAKGVVRAYLLKQGIDPDPLMQQLDAIAARRITP